MVFVVVSIIVVVVTFVIAVVVSVVPPLWPPQQHVLNEPEEVLQVALDLDDVIPLPLPTLPPLTTRGVGRAVDPYLLSTTTAAAVPAFPHTPHNPPTPGTTLRRETEA